MEELVDNAIKFTLSGEICLGISEVSKNNITFFVEDSGIGIERQHQKKIFEAFYMVDSSSKRRFGGIGMGLTTAQSLAGVLGGEIRVNSVLGEGSEFFFELPLYSYDR